VGVADVPTYVIKRWNRGEITTQGNERKTSAIGETQAGGRATAICAAPLGGGKPGPGGVKGTGGQRGNNLAGT